MRAANMWIPNFNEMIKRKNIRQVSSLFIKEPSTNLFHAEGLFSESIFGQVASLDRLVRYGYIDLKTNIIHPGIYERLLGLNRFYESIMSGKSEAVFDSELEDFVRMTNIKNILPHQEAGTGYSFFLKHLPKIKFKETDSLKRLNNITLMNKYKDITIIDKFIVSPAGIRDYNVENSKQQMEEANEIYANILISTFSLPSIKTEDPIWDSIRFNLQKKVLAIYQYLYDIIEGKGGMIQKKYAARSVALGTRNILTGTKISSYSSQTKRHETNETLVPLFQAAKGFMPLVVYYMNTLFLNNILDGTSNSMYVIEPKTLDFIKIDIDEDDRKKLTSKDGLVDRVESFRTAELRKRNLIINKNGKNYFLFLVYDDGDEIHLFRNKIEFSTYYRELKGHDPDPSKIRPLTNAEFLYICTEFACKGKHVQTTRYPLLGTRNTYMAKIVVMTTDPARKVIFVNTLTGESTDANPFYHYPDLNGEFVDGVRIHSIWLKNIGGDHDGDSVNNVSILSNNANAEISNYMNSKKYFLTPSGKLKLTISALNPLIDLTLKNMCLRTFKDSPLNP